MLDRDNGDSMNDSLGTSATANPPRRALLSGIPMPTTVLSASGPSNLHYSLVLALTSIRGQYLIRAGLPG